MKAITAISNGGPGVSNGRVSRRQGDHGNGENAEIKMYLSKLKDLVPFMPKNRKLSKLEIIQNVIDYICDLQSELETHPVISTFDAVTVLSDESEDIYYNERNSNNNINNQRSNNNSPSSHHHHIRKPLVDRSSPNTILSDSEVHQQNVINNQQLIHSHTAADKST